LILWKILIRKMWEIMAKRGIFIPKDKYPYFEEIQVEYEYFQGLSKQQKRRSYLSLHLNFLATSDYANRKVLEISSAGIDWVGEALSAMNLRKYSNKLKKYVSLESAFQSSRIYTTDTGEKIGPFPEALEMAPKEAKKYVKEKSRGFHSYEYLYEGMMFPAPKFHISLFYDWLYINALCEEANSGVLKYLIDGGYNAFTDIATKALNSQARSAALFVGLEMLGLTEQARDRESYFKLFRIDMQKDDFVGKDAYENVQVLQKDGSYTPLHPVVKQTVDKEKVKEFYNELIS